VRPAGHGDGLTSDVTADDVLIAGAGIGGLTAALALAQRGFRVNLFEQSEKLEEAGAGIQLSPNATRVLIALGLGERLRAAIVEPVVLRLRAGRSGRDIATMPLGATMRERYGAPYWVVHRADLQRALLGAVTEEPRISLMLGATVTDFAVATDGVHIGVSRDGASARHHGLALIGADGLRSIVRARLGDPTAPRLIGRAAWRTVAPAELVEPQYLEPVVNLWFGRGWHLVHYPVRGSAEVNIVWVQRDAWESTAWSTAVDRAELVKRSNGLPRQAREFVQGINEWQRWTLSDRAPAWRWGDGPVTLLGDAAHPMLPFLAQGAAIAIEDAAVLAQELSRCQADPAQALRRYEKLRQPRAARVQGAARRNDFVYHLGEPASLVRDTILGALGGTQLLAQYDWIYRWQP
jgi:2-polyprenyl-6-methoxyphenol hydroxylase-like FAD-dependent oxidoreductase